MVTNRITWPQILHYGSPAHCKPAAKTTLAGTCLMHAWVGILLIMMTVLLRYFILTGMVPMKAALMMVSNNVAQSSSIYLSVSATSS